MYIVKQRSAVKPGESEVMRYTKENEAIQFIQEKLQQDILYKMNNIYVLYEGDDKLSEFNQQDALASIKVASQESDTASAEGAGNASSQSFKPTPFNTSPRLGPQSYVRDEENKEK